MITKYDRNTVLTRTIERPGLHIARERNAVLVFNDFESVTFRFPGIGVLGLSDIVPFILGRRLSASRLPVLTVAGSALAQHCLDTFLDVRESFQVTLGRVGVGFTRDANSKRLVERAFREPVIVWVTA